MDEIKSLYDVRPGDMYIGNIGGAVGVGVAVGEIVIGDGFRIGQLSARHVGIVTEAGDRDSTPVRPPRMAQAMPGGAEIVDLTPWGHWTPRNVFIRLPEDYPGQALDAAAVAEAMVAAGVAYSPLSYGAIALAWRGIDPPSLLKWIDRRGEPVKLDHWSNGPTVPPYPGWTRGGRMPVEAICSVFFDQAWTMAGKQVMPEGTPAQLVTPGGLARAWFRAPGTVCGGAGLLESA